MQYAQIEIASSGTPETVEYDQFVESTAPAIDSIPDIATWIRLKRLIRQWKRETLFFSSSHQSFMNSNYQKIIGMGMSVVPLLLQALKEDGPEHFDWALAAITSDNPVPQSVEGDIRSICDAWLDWGRRHNLID